MRIAAYFLMVLNTLVWGGLVWIGVGLMQGVAERHVPGYPNNGQIAYYVVTPLVVLAGRHASASSSPSNTARAPRQR